jgi:hypothetical protein
MGGAVMNDREFLGAAAKAAGMSIERHKNSCVMPSLMFVSGGKNWNPLTDDGDALRLAVKLQMSIEFYGVVVANGKATPKAVEANVMGNSACGHADEAIGQDRLAATRRAIVCATAEFGNK